MTATGQQYCRKKTNVYRYVSLTQLVIPSIHNWFKIILKELLFKLQIEIKVKTRACLALQVVAVCELHSPCEKQSGMSVRTYRLTHSGET